MQYRNFKLAKRIYLKNHISLWLYIGLIYFTLRTKKSWFSYYLPLTYLLIVVLASSCTGYLKNNDQVLQPAPVESPTADIATQDDAKHLNDEGLELLHKQEFESALLKFEQALQSYNMIGDQSGSAEEHFNIGLTYTNLKDPQNALDHFSQSLTLWQNLGMVIKEADTLVNMASIYSNLGEYQEVILAYERALELYQSNHEDHQAALVLNGLGDAHYSLKNYKQSLNYLEQAQWIWQKLQDKENEALTIRLIERIKPLAGSIIDPVLQCTQSLLLLPQGQFTKAKPQLEDAVENLKLQSNADQNALGMCAIFLGIVHHSTSDWVEALDAYTTALAAFQKNGDPQMEWVAQFGVGTVYVAQGRFVEVYKTLQETLPLTGGANNADEEACEDTELGADAVEGKWSTEIIKPLARAVNLNNIGLAIAVPLSQQQKTGADYEKAHRCFTAAIEILKRLGRQSSNSDDMLSTMLLNLTLGGGSSEDMLGDVFNNVIFSAVVPELAKSFEPILLSNLGQVYAFEGDNEQAQSYLEQALEQVRASQAQNNNAELQAILPMLDIFSTMPGLSLDPQMQDLMRSLPEMLTSLSLVSNVINLNGEAVVLNNLAWVYNAQEETDLAQATFEEALDIYENKVANYPGAVTVHVNLGWLAQQSGDIASALNHYEQAIKLLASVRSVGEGDIAQIRRNSVQTLNLVGNEGLLSQQADVYALATNLYLQLGKPSEALQTLEQGRARLFFDMMSAGNPSLPDADAEMLNSVREAFDLRTQAKISLVQMRAAGGSRNLTGLAEDEMQKAEELYQSRLNALRTDRPLLLPLIPDANTVIDLPALQTHVLSDTTAIVYYFAEGFLQAPTDKLAVALVIDADNITAIPLDVDAKMLYSQIQAVRESISGRDFYFEASDLLYQEIIAPLRPYIEHNNLTIVPYGSLYYLPFAALWDEESKQYLIEDYTITYAPSIGALPLIQSNRNPNEGRMLALGDADGSLPNAITETEAIAKLYGVESITGMEASESLVYTESPQIDFLHLATHGTYSQADPLTSKVLLAPDENNDGNLRVDEIFGMDLGEVNLVVLSACRTALGDQSTGDEITGLTRAFLYAGTPSIITTLWSIEDESTAALMTSFYTHLRQEPSFAAALQAAQLEILKTEKWHDPYYWAAFTLQGDYLGVGERATEPNPNLTVKPTPEATPTPEGSAQLKVLISTLNVRSGPGTAYPIIGKLKAGDQVEITGRNAIGTWWEVCCVGEQSGWVINNENYLEVKGEVGEVPEK